MKFTCKVLQHRNPAPPPPSRPARLRHMAKSRPKQRQSRSARSLLGPPGPDKKFYRTRSGLIYLASKGNRTQLKSPLSDVKQTLSALLFTARLPLVCATEKQASHPGQPVQLSPGAQLPLWPRRLVLNGACRCRPPPGSIGSGGAVQCKMSVGVAERCLKRLLDEPQDASPKCKRVCPDVPPPPPPPDAGPPLHLSPAKSPSPQSNQSQSKVRVGPYFLFERCEGEDTYRAVHAATQQQYTCQVLPLSSYQEKLAVYARLGRHGNICGLLDTVIQRDGAYLFLAAHHGDMHAHVRSSKRLGEEEAGLVFAQMLEAVAHCHRSGVVLRDVKLRRFVFTDRFRTRVALLGLTDCVLLQRGDSDSMTDRHGCPAYVGPELLASGKASYSGCAADVWSLGVSLYTMLVGRYPFQDTRPAALFAKIRRGAFSLPGWLSPPAKCLIGCMLRKSPAERLRASELPAHPWLSDRRAPPLGPTQRRGSGRAPGLRHEDDDQVVPTCAEKH
ncbi:tribbles homolog 3-like isoform X1 [Phycodurus eques]|uniref:tribbles homolog 3-like isoform X1 n=3 Tax=Phycodurus eques TaxID=693459 RepID=UPI002ACE4705|nr:tribbles homolog 3-like isoform X1 [Phycodurus eques]